jgi:uncharacterized protein (DUF934 family)
MSVIHQTDVLKSEPVLCDTAGNIFTNINACDATIEPAEFISSGEDKHVLRKIRAWLDANPDIHSIEIKIPKFTDGRGFSIAARFREAGFTGELHASGDITQDLIFLLRRVGFTHFRLALGANEKIDQNVLKPFSAHYQAAQDGSHPVWQRA